MLSKVAERVYWTARYLERIESTARLISIYDKLLFDLPRSVHLSWYNLITINSLDEAFTERYGVRDERNVVKFLIGDESNSSFRAFLYALHKNGNRPWPGPGSMNPTYLMSMVNMRVEEKGIRLQKAAPDTTRKNDTVERYQFVRIEK